MPAARSPTFWRAIDQPGAVAGSAPFKRRARVASPPQRGRRRRPACAAGPLALPVALPGVAGLTALPNSNGTVQVRWDAWTARAILGYRVERGFDGKWTLAADVDASTQTWTETQSGDGVRRQWRVRARLAGGALSPASPAVEFCLQPVPAHPGNIRFANATVTGAEGESLPIRIVREGGSDGPAFVTWSSWGWAGSATPEADYTPGAGLLIFAPGETEKTVNVALQADNLRSSRRELTYLKRSKAVPAGGAFITQVITTGPNWPGNSGCMRLKTIRPKCASTCAWIRPRIIPSAWATSFRPAAAPPPPARTSPVP